MAGFLNKQVAGELGISKITVQAHRGKVMLKMGADSLAALVGMAGILGIARPALRIRSPAPNSRSSILRLAVPA